MCLCIQAQKNHVECVSILLSSAGVNDIPDGEGRTALMWAAQRGNYKVLEVMLEKEVDVHAFDNLGGTGMYMYVISPWLCRMTCSVLIAC